MCLWDGGVEAAAPCPRRSTTATGLEALTVVEWRMQLLLKSKHREKGGGGGGGGSGGRGLPEVTAGGPGPSKPSSRTPSRGPSRGSSRPSSRPTSRPASRDTSPVHEAANFHPDLVSPGGACCESPYRHHHYHHHGHHHGHHHLHHTCHHGAWDARGSHRQYHRGGAAHDLLDGVPDPRFAPTCPCGGRLSRSSSWEADCPPDVAESGCFPKGRSKGHGDGCSGGRSGRRGTHKDGRGRIRRLIDLSVIMGIFKPCKVSVAMATEGRQLYTDEIALLQHREETLILTQD